MFNLMQFVVPASLIDGWVCYFWDMKRKIIHVLDPLNLTGISDARRCVHEDVTAVLHGAFVRCLGCTFMTGLSPIHLGFGYILYWEGKTSQSMSNTLNF